MSSSLSRAMFRRAPSPVLAPRCCRPRLEALEHRSVPSVLISGPPKVAAGVPYTLNLTADEPLTQWTINWGDGNVQTVAGNPSTVSHTYTGGTANRNISATALRPSSTIATAGVAAAGQFIDTFVPAGSGGLQVVDGRGMAFGPDGNLYVGVANATALVAKYDGSTGASLGTFIAQGSGGQSTLDDQTWGPDGN